MNKMHTLVIETIDKKTGNILKTEKEFFRSIYNAERREFEINDNAANSVPYTVKLKTYIERIAA